MYLARKVVLLNLKIYKQEPNEKVKSYVLSKITIHFEKNSAVLVQKQPISILSNISIFIPDPELN